MKRASVATRLDRLTTCGHVNDRERLVLEVAVETGLDLAEVRAELAAIEGHAGRFGPPTITQAVRRWAEELGLPEGEVWDAYRAVAGRAGRGP